MMFVFAGPCVAQTHFYLDEPFKRPAEIPNGLLPMLRNQIKSVCPGDPAFQATDIRSLFSASRISLNHRPAFILKSGHICLTGADNAWFWVYVKTAGRYRSVLTGGTISVDVLRARTHGFRDIETNMATAAFGFRKIYKFSGSAYEPRVCSESEMRERNPKPHRVPCQR